MKKIAKVQSWVPPVNVIQESVHGAGVLKQADPKKALGFFAKSQTKAHMLRDQLAPVLEDEDEEVFMEQKGEELAVTVMTMFRVNVLIWMRMRVMIYHSFVKSAGKYSKHSCGSAGTWKEGSTKNLQ